jgi:Uma2 family endonuclease
MATSALITAEQYLATHFGEREPEFVHGELVSRPMPTWIHGRLQHLLSVRLHGVGFCATEVRMRLRDDLFRIPDLAVFVGSPPAEQVPTSPPFIVVEITSPDDRHQDLLQKLEEYRAWGVAHIWVVEPELKKLLRYHAGGLVQVDQFELPEFGFRVTAAELFAAEMPAPSQSRFGK